MKTCYCKQMNRSLQYSLFIICFASAFLMLCCDEKHSSISQEGKDDLSAKNQNITSNAQSPMISASPSPSPSSIFIPTSALLPLPLPSIIAVHFDDIPSYITKQLSRAEFDNIFSKEKPESANENKVVFREDDKPLFSTFEFSNGCLQRYYLSVDTENKLLPEQFVASLSGIYGSPLMGGVQKSTVARWTSGRCRIDLEVLPKDGRQWVTISFGRLPEQEAGAFRKNFPAGPSTESYAQEDNSSNIDQHPRDTNAPKHTGPPKIGDTCQTKCRCFGALTEEDLDKGMNMLKKNDRAFAKMLLEGRVIDIREGADVEVEDLTFLTGKAKIRVRGETESLWVYVVHLQ